MALLIPDYPDPQGAPGATIPQAYAWIENILAGFSDWTGRVVVWVHRSPEAAASWIDPAHPNVPPADQRTYVGGQELAPGVRYPTLAEKLQDPEYAAAFAVIRAKEYGWLRLDPDLADGIDVP